MTKKKQPHVIERDSSAFRALACGEKSHEVGPLDDDFQFGDSIEIYELDLETGARTGEVIRARLGWVSGPGEAGLQAGICSFDLLDVEAAPQGVAPSSRLGRTLHGHHMELLAAFERSAAHKLPGSKGRLRENAVAKFLMGWMPKRYSALTNVFASDPEAGAFENEIDLVLHDSHEGPEWALDGEDENWVVSWEHVKVVFEVKSTLDASTWRAAEQSMNAIEGYARLRRGALPLRVLLAFRLDRDFEDDPGGFRSSIELAITHPFDLIVVLGHGAYYAPNVEEIALAFLNGITAEQASSDLRVANARLKTFVASSHQKYWPYCALATGTETTLMAFIFACSERCAGSGTTLALLHALGAAGQYIPLFEQEPVFENS